ncbi:dihydroorotate dehydrogenase electron transfer subunit [Desulfurobacterium pacificum]|uniref:Dihydroorotate dehydrogenase electron transfer subunit n=1 Tax=Desulfurobacterium pacificum TaxID=240166 RepID=A0ABY1NIS5_9BACT|nr:dihydroorotate dehydrogenase electron transfer subunit [Desulfurobacterium pacificum]SMP10944.1 dihydroorotate dehydrogenase electron transfer subunit [Desulfurobacterium pacificum]
MNFKIVENRKLSEKDFLLTVEINDRKLLNKIKPGQFAMVSVSSPQSFDPLLKRPLGIFNVEENNISFIYRVYGRGTKLLTTFKKGEQVSVLLPLGNSIPDQFDRYLFIAGGIGIGGVFLAAKTFLQAGKDVHLLYGEKSKENLSALPVIEKYKIPTTTFTEDGSYGKKGFVTEGLSEFKDRVWIACGPIPMLKAVKETAEKLKVKCFLSLDMRMACGVGACLGCVVKTTSGYKRCCVEGPIFDASEVLL